MKDCLSKAKASIKQAAKPVLAPQRRRRLRIGNSAGINRVRTINTLVRSKAGAPTRAYAIRAKEKVIAPDVIVYTFSLFDIYVHALIDPG